MSIKCYNQEVLQSYTMASSLLALIFVLSQCSTNSQRINDEKWIEGSCKSQGDYLNKMEDLRFLMIEQRDHQKEMDNVRKEKQEMENRLTLLEKLWNTAKAELSKSEDLRISMMEQLNELTGYKQELEDFKQECQNNTKDFQTFHHQQTNITSGQQEELEKLRKDNQEMKDRLILLENLWNTKKGQSKDIGFVGFTVRFEAQNLPQQNSIIKPSIFITNYSSSFSNRGEFVCSRDGIYVFFLHLVTDSRSNGAWIYKNDIPMTLTWQDGPSVSTVVSGTTSLVADLRVGDRISIKSYKNDLNVNETSAWTGHLISETSNEYIVMQSTLKHRENSNVISGKEMITNIGNANNSLETGDFVCIQTGTYKIDINTVIKAADAGVKVYVNDKHVRSLHSWHSQNGYSSCSTTAVLNFTLGDRITLKVSKTDALMSTYSIFAFYLLSPLFDVDSGFSCTMKSAAAMYLTCSSPITTLNSSGYFTCKEEGYYYSSVNLLTRSSNNGIQIYRNEEALTFAWIGDNWGIWDSTSTSVVIHLKVGDYITFRQMRNNLGIDHASRIVVYKIHP